MALAGNSIILHNRAPLPTSLTPSNFRCKPINFYSKPQSLAHYNIRISPLSCFAKSTFISDDVEVQSINPTATPTTTWSEFASNVSGEWDGFGAEFTSEGNPVELPESVVPEAFREWEVKVFDWQTQCPTLAQSQEFAITYKTIKLLPTVGCEADAATRYSIDERNIGGIDNKVSAFAYQSSGCYVAVWPIQDNGMDKQFELEYCLIHPQDKESRVRVIQVVHVVNSKMTLKNIRVFCEQWYGQFRNGDQLGGCAIRDSAFASTAALQSYEVVGVWQGPTAVASFNASQTCFLKELKGDTMQKSVRDEHDLILLPKQLWCSLKGGKDGETISKVGWVSEHGFATTSTCIFSSDAKLKVCCYC
ncbi:uncharacterized protein LOC8286566 isoform X2 [Ricinus communis]|uniref:uncharacterized protein LOC8286566 isoform X2 n=1 Tax=Ricinus communis TaxID=3988 RepID=UPI00201A7793|nr:uncharacterized protein LOC8286566 isoform X2 [Ricinus communis]